MYIFNDLRIRTNNQDVTDKDHNSGATGNTITISEITLSTEEDQEIIKQNARRRLSKIFYTESNCWAYVRHNKWGNNSWGPDCTQAVFGTEDTGQSYFHFTNKFFQDMKLAGYSKFSFHVSAVCVEDGKEIKNLAVSSGGTQAWNMVYSEVNDVTETTFSFDVTEFLTNLNDNDIVFCYIRTAQPEYAAVNSIITLSAITFEE